MGGIVPPRSYLGDGLILEIAELLPGPDSIAPPLLPGTFSLDILFVFSLRPAVHSLHTFVISSFFQPFSFRAVSEAELVRIRQAVRALADWAVFVGRSSLCMVHGRRVNPDRWPDVVIPAQAASMLRIFESILDHYGYYLPDGTKSPEMTAQHVMIVHGLQSIAEAHRQLHRIRGEYTSTQSLLLNIAGILSVSRSILEAWILLKNIFIALHVTLSEAPMASPSWVCHHTAMFILLLSRIQDYVEPLRGAAPGSRIPTPSYAALNFIGKVILSYGLEGDHVPGLSDKHCRKAGFAVGELVYLSTKNLKLPKKRARKLLPKYLGPFKILTVVSPGMSYKLELSRELKTRGIHDVFHASLLRPHFPSDDRRFPGRQIHQIPGFGVNPKEWAVDRILSHLGKGTEASFEMLWATGDVTWAPYAEVKHLAAMDGYCEAMGIKHPRNLPLKGTRHLSLLGSRPLYVHLFLWNPHPIRVRCGDIHRAVEKSTGLHRT
ncbi:hypothetical protein C8F01DRAFT_1092109 [Mycena amicta]|nr:hypothetical protein C8F01DRAFT_1092109 [Mycena amicta]